MCWWENALCEIVTLTSLVICSKNPRTTNTFWLLCSSYSPLSTRRMPLRIVKLRDRKKIEAFYWNSIQMADGILHLPEFVFAIRFAWILMVGFIGFQCIAPDCQRWRKQWRILCSFSDFCTVHIIELENDVIIFRVTGGLFVMRLLQTQRFATHWSMHAIDTSTRTRSCFFNVMAECTKLW